MELDDVKLLTAVAGGSERAFNALVDRYQQSLRTFLRGRDDAEDIAQETFVAVWSQAKSFRGQSTVKSWLFSIGWRKAKDSQRRWFRSSLRDAAYLELSPSDQERTGVAENSHALNQALAALSLEQRAAVVLCLGLGLSHPEAAELLTCPLGTVKSHVLRGRAKLREILGAEKC
jgi:RNA polymerase sigma factor (sigma-70 family)